MKKLLLMLIAVLGLSLNLMADTTASCKISGGQDGATVVASIVEIGDGYVMVDLSNDGNFNVNVRINISGHAGLYGSGNYATLVPAQGGKTVRVPVPDAKSDYKTNNYSISINGSRCN